MSVEKKIDELTTLVKSHGKKMDCMDEKVQKITTVLGGSGLGEKGLLEQYAELNESHHKLKRNVRDANVITRFSVWLVGALVAGWEFVKHMLFK